MATATERNINKRNSKPAPCLYLRFNERKQKDELIYPSVNCDHDCEHCGWNPDEHERRIRTGKCIVRNGITTIVFKRRMTDAHQQCE